jgi:hypothetical protein
MIRWRDGDGRLYQGSLFAALAALACGDAWSFPALRPHQREPWHAFTVQVAALALIQAGIDELPTDETSWRDLLIGLTPEQPNGEAWALVVDDWSKPALLQPPVLVEANRASYKTKAEDVLQTPDALDMLVTSRNHDVKQERIGEASDEDWLFALVTLQTMEGIMGAGRYGISRMFGGYGNRMSLGVRPVGGGASAVFKRDVRRVVSDARSRPDPQADLDRPLAKRRPTVGPAIVGAHAQQLQRADDAGGAAELVERQQAQCVAHDDADAGAEQPVRTEPAQRDGEGGKSQIRLGLAAAGREEQQVRGFAVGAALVGEAVEVEQNEGELEGAPRRRMVAGAAGATGVGDGTVGDGEGGADALVPGEQGNSAGDAVAGDRLCGDQRRGGPRPLRCIGDIGGGRRLLLRGRPIRVTGDQWNKCGMQRRAVVRRKRGETVHPEFDATDRGGDGSLHGGARQVRGVDAADDAVGIHGVAGRAAKPDRKSGGIAIMEVGELSSIVDSPIELGRKRRRAAVGSGSS